MTAGSSLDVDRIQPVGTRHHPSPASTPASDSGPAAGRTSRIRCCRRRRRRRSSERVPKTAAPHRRTLSSCSARASASKAAADSPWTTASHLSASTVSPSSWVCMDSPGCTSCQSSAFKTGPCRVERTTNTIGSLRPLTRISWRRTVSGSQSSPERYRVREASSCSMKKSWTSAPTFVKPHATRALCPMMMKGMPGMVTPETFSVSDTHALPTRPRASRASGADRSPGSAGRSPYAIRERPSCWTWRVHRERAIPAPEDSRASPPAPHSLPLAPFRRRPLALIPFPLPLTPCP